VADDDDVLGNVDEGRDDDGDEVDVCRGTLEVVCSVLVASDGNEVGDEEVVVDAVVVGDEDVIVSDEEVVCDKLVVLLSVVADD
jgi:hypothetical protein